MHKTEPAPLPVSASLPLGEGAEDNVLQLYLGDTRQLFNSMDPAPFRERDLDTKAADYIIDWARDVSTDLPLSLVVHLGQASANADDEAMLRTAMHDYFARRAVATRRKLRQLFRKGRISLLIGLAFMGLVMLLSEAISNWVGPSRDAALVKDSLIIGGWVALWRPAEIFLHEWWPILEEARLFDRLSTMRVGLYCVSSTPFEPEPKPS